MPRKPIDKTQENGERTEKTMNNIELIEIPAGECPFLFFDDEPKFPRKNTL